MSSTIELNGKRYDARTGKIVGEASTSPPSSPKPKPTQVGALDGFSRRPTVSANPMQKLKSATTPLTTPKATQRQLDKAHTLMRPAVKKPAVIKNDVQGQKRHTKPSHIDLARKARAEFSSKSPSISKFSSHNVSNIVKKEAHLPVAAQRVAAEVERQASKELQRIEQAISGATAHLNQLEKNTVKKAKLIDRVLFKNRIANIATASLSFILLAGFFAYQNAPAIEMRVAATRSGVSAQMPGYKPAGYGLAGGVDTSPGKVSVSFKSRTDDKAFKITQQASNWNSTSLLANHVAKANQPYQTYQNDGKTVYIFDNSNATWVNGGIWYEVAGNASLTSDQLLRLANSF